MILKTSKDSTALNKLFKCFLLFITGLVIVLLCSLFHQLPLPAKGEYFYSNFLRTNYTLLARVIFIISGFLIGYFYQLNPWYSGISLFLIFPITSVIEALIYSGSHNLIPFEFAFHLLMAIPTVISVFLGRLLFRQVAKRRAKKIKSLQIES